MSSPFLRGLTVGAQLGSTMRSNERQGKLDARADEEYEKKKAADEAYAQLQKDYYTNQGDFAPRSDAPAEAVAKADASYAQAENRRFGVQTPEAAPDAAPTPGLSLSPAESQALQPKPMDPGTKDKLYYQKLNAWAATNLPPEKAVAFRKESEQLQEMDFNRQRLNGFRLAASGKQEGLDIIAKLYNEQMPDGWDLDISKAEFVPGEGWTGIQRVQRETGKAQPLKGDNTSMATMFMASDPAQFLKAKIELNQDARADRTEGRQERVADATIRQADQRFGLDVARFAEDVKRNKETGSREWASLNLRQQAFELEKKFKEGDEKAGDLRSRQAMFISSFGANRKLGDMPTDADKADAAIRDQNAALATTLYGLSTEGVDSKERNAIQAEVQNFVTAYSQHTPESPTLDMRLLKRNADGSYNYGRVKVPASMLPDSGPAPAAGGKPGLKTEAPKVQGRPLYDAKTSELQRMAAKPRGVSSAEAAAAQAELDARKGESRMGAF